MGNNPTLYAYVNSWVDVFGLELLSAGLEGSSNLFPTSGSQQNIVQIKLTGVLILLELLKRQG